MNLIQVFEKSLYAENQVNRLSFYVGILNSEAHRHSFPRQHKYTDQIIKPGLFEFKNLAQLKKLYVAAEKLLLENQATERYKNIVSDLFLSVSPADYLESNEPQLCFGAGLAVSREDIESVLTATEAATLWKLEASTVKKSCQQGRFSSDEARKSGGTWIVSAEGMERVYGPKPDDSGD